MGTVRLRTANEMQAVADHDRDPAAHAELRREITQIGGGALTTEAVREICRSMIQGGLVVLGSSVSFGDQWGLSPEVGVSAEVARADHNHGTPAMPNWQQVGADQAGSAAAVAALLGTHEGLTTSAHGGIVATTDGRLSDARTPLGHDQALTTITTAIAAGTILKSDGTNPVASSITEAQCTANNAKVSFPGFGTTSVLACVGNDSRLSDARTPTSHVHGNITNAGAIGSTSGLPIVTGASGVLQAGAFGVAAGTFCQGNDGRLSDARTPLAHNQAWNTITGTPKTLAGYGITDAAGLASNTFTDRQTMERTGSGGTVQQYNRTTDSIAIDVAFSTNNSSRWIWRFSGAETGANAGSVLDLIRRADDGSNLGSIVNFYRDTGLVRFQDDVNVVHDLIIGTDPGGTESLRVAGNAVFTGALKLSDGTVSAPSITFSGDTNTGIFRVSGDSIGFVCGGERSAYVTDNAFYKRGYEVQQTFLAQRANGTEAAPTKILNGDYIGGLAAGSYFDDGVGGVGWGNGTGIRFYATEDRNSSGNLGQRTVFTSISNGSGSASTRGVLTESGSWLIGAVNVTSEEITLSSIGTYPRFQMLGTSAAGQSAILQARFDETAGDAPQHILAKSRGTAVGSFTAVANNDLLGIWAGEGADGTDFARAGSIRNYCDGTVSANDVPGRWEFYTANSSGVETLAMKINSSQQVILGTDPGGSERLRVGGAINANNEIKSTLNGRAIYASAGHVASVGGYRDGYSNQVLGDRITGWVTPTGTVSRLGWDTATVSLSTLARCVAALITDLKTHGMIGG